MTQAKHFTDLAIRGFRGLADITFEKLGRINVIVGSNDIGKTSVLEAVFLLSGFARLSLPVLLQNTRGHVVENFQDLLLLFYNLADRDLQLSASTPQDSRRLTISVARADVIVDQKSQLPKQTRIHDDRITDIMYSSARGNSEHIEIDAEITPKSSDPPTKHNATLSVRNGKFKSDPPQSADSLNAAINARIMFPGARCDTEAVSEVLVRKKQDVLVDCLRRINPQIAGVAVSKDIAYVDIGLETMIPLNMCGSGLVRAADIISSCILGQVHMLLIDEIGSGLHHSATQPVLEAIISICEQQDIQVFVTTHSLEVLQCVQHVLDSDSFGHFRDETQTYRLARDKDDRVRAYRYGYGKYPAVRRRELTDTIAKMNTLSGVDISTFLLPNNSDPGCLETLLEAMAVKSHRGIYECFDGYQDCLKDRNVRYHMPDAKARIYAYCNALGIEAQPTERDYADSNHWNLDAPELKQLKQFLRSLTS